MIASDSCAELRSPIGLGPAADSDRLRTVATAGLIRAAGLTLSSMILSRVGKRTDQKYQLYYG